MLPMHCPTITSGMNMPRIEANTADVRNPDLFLFGGPPSGVITLPKITTTTIRARPERCIIRNAPILCLIVAGRAVGEQLKWPPKGIPQDANPAAFTALIADDEGWRACTFDDQGEPDAVYRSNVLFLPYTAHLSVLRRMRV